jgi:hypothetical protein
VQEPTCHHGRHGGEQVSGAEMTEGQRAVALSMLPFIGFGLGFAASRIFESGLIEAVVIASLTLIAFSLQRSLKGHSSNDDRA